MGRCKRHTNELPDFDNRGRCRRFDERGQVKKALAVFLDGPVAGQRLLVEDGADYVNIGGIRYSYAGKMKRVRAYARVPKTHAARRMVKQFIERTGRDPRLVFDKKGQRRDT